MRNILFYQGKTQYSNTGDALINKSLIAHFRSKAKVYFSDRNIPKNYLEQLELLDSELTGLTGISFVFHTILYSLKSTFKPDIKVYYLATVPGHQFGAGFKNAVKQLCLFFMYMLLYISGVKIIKIGFSIGPIDRAASILEKMKSFFIPYYYVRDPVSLKLVHDIGIKKAKFFPDLAWTYSVPLINNVADKVIFISFRTQVLSGNGVDNYSKELEDKLELLLNSCFIDYKIVIGYQVEEDKDFCKYLYNKLKTSRDVLFIEEQISLSDAHLYAQFRYLLTNRLHVGLLGFQYGSLPLILSDVKKHLKIKGIFEDAKSDHLLLDIKEENSKLVIDCNKIMKNYDINYKDLVSEKEKYKLKSVEIINNIFSN